MLLIIIADIIFLVFWIGIATLAYRWFKNRQVSQYRYQFKPEKPSLNLESRFNQFSEDPHRTLEPEQLSSLSEVMFDRFNLRKKHYFFSQAERGCFLTLLNISEGLPLTVLSKVRLNDLLETIGDNRQATNNRINRMHVDFVLLTRPDFRPVIGIELDGASHKFDRQQTRDLKKDAAFKAAGLPLIRLPNTTSSAQLKQALEPYLQAATAPNKQTTTARTDTNT